MGDCLNRILYSVPIQKHTTMTILADTKNRSKQKHILLPKCSVNCRTGRTVVKKRLLQAMNIISNCKQRNGLNFIEK